MTRAEVDKKLDEIVEFAEMAPFIDTPAKRYSSGMTVRLAFSVAAHLEPEILLVDEVLAVGDAAFQKKCLGKMQDVSSHGRTVLFVSHNMGTINALCSEAILLEKGGITHRGTPESTIDRYLMAEGASPGDGTAAAFEVEEEILASQKFPELTVRDIVLEHPRGAALRTGEPPRIRIRYFSPRRLASPAFIVKVKNFVGQELIRLSTMPISGYPISRAFESGEVVLTLDALPLVAGRYSLGSPSPWDPVMTDELSRDHQRLAQILTLVEREDHDLLAVRRRLFGAKQARTIDVDWLRETLKTPQGIDRLESFGAKFSRLQDTLMDKLLPQWLRAAGEQPGAVIDNLNRAEQLGLIVRTDDWLAMRRLRNRLVHEYVEDLQVMLEALRRAYEFVDQLHTAYLTIQQRSSH
jgi:hypothetical protein